MGAVKLHEYQAKRILARYGIPVPPGELVEQPAAADPGGLPAAGHWGGPAAAEAAQRLGGRVAVKAQVLSGGRGKAGGVRVVATPAEAAAAAEAILALHIQGLPVHKLLVERAAAIARELYVGLTLDRTAGRVVLMASGEGGIDIEQVAQSHPGAILRLPVDPFLGLRPYHLRYLGAFLQVPAALQASLDGLVQALYRAFVESDASLVEINPLVVTEGDELLALDAKVVLDDNALFRHSDLAALRNPEEESPAEAQAREAGLSYIALGGQIGCLVNGAGLAMATLDTIRALGGMPANFLDIGGGARAERVAQALQIMLQEPRVRAVLLNIFGGITRCDEVARGVVAALQEVHPWQPVVARLVGTREAEGRAILAGAGIQTVASLTEAARLAVSMSA